MAPDMAWLSDAGAARGYTLAAGRVIMPAVKKLRGGHRVMLCAGQGTWREGSIRKCVAGNQYLVEMPSLGKGSIHRLRLLPSKYTSAVDAPRCAWFKLGSHVSYEISLAVGCVIMRCVEVVGAARQWQRTVLEGVEPQDCDVPVYRLRVADTGEIIEDCLLPWHRCEPLHAQAGEWFAAM